LALEATDVGAWNVDLIHHTAWRSLRHGQIFGYAEPLPPWSDEAFLQHVLEEDRAGVVQTIEQAVARGEAWYLECRIRRVDGAVRWIWVQGQSIRDGQGQPTGMSGLVRDITAVKAIEESEQRNAERLRQGIRVARLGLFEHDHRTNEIYYSPVMREIFGWGESEPVTLPEITGRILPEDRPAFVAAVQHAHDPAGEGRFSIEFRLRRPDGTMRWASAQSQTTFAGDGPARHPVRTIGALVDITERKAAEEQLQARERRFRALTEKAADDIILLDARGRIVYESPHETPLLGFATGEMTGQPGLELVHAEDLPLARQKLGEMLRSPGATSQGELRLRRKEGGWSWVQFRATNLLHDPAVQAIVVNLHNITERKAAEAALRRFNATLEDQVAERTRALAGSETRYRALVTASSDVLYRMSPDWAEMRHLIGRDFIADTAAPSRTWLEKYIPPDEQQPVMAAIQEAIRTRGVFDLEHRVRRVDGSLGWTHSRAIPILDAAGKVVEWFGMARDITQRKAAEESLRESEARLRAVLDGTPDPVYLKDRDCRLVLANPATFAVIGKPAEACLGKTDEQFYDDPADGRAIMANDHRIMATGQSETVEEVVHAASGPRSYLTTKAPYRDAAGNVIGLIGLARDITERKRAEAALADASRLNQQIITDVRQGIIVYGPDMKYLVWNRFMEDMTGYPASEVLGRHPLEVFPFLRDTGVIECVTEVLAGKEVPAREFPHPQLKTGKPGWVSDQNSPLRNAKGEIVGVIGIVRDITERKEAEEALRASEELFRVIAASTPDHLVVQDAELRYTLVLNPQLGLTERDMLGHTDFDIMPAAEAEQLTRIKRRVLETGQPERVEAAATSQTGGQEYFEGTYVAKFDARGQADGVIGYFRNVTARKLAAQELKELNESLERRVAERTAELQNHSARLALLSDAASALLTATDPVIFLDGIFSRLSSLLGLEVCVHYERLPGTECLRLAVCRGLPDEVTEKIRELKFGQAICGTVAATGQPMVVENVQNTSEPEAMLIRSLGMTAYACYPCWQKGASSAPSRSGPASGPVSTRSRSRSSRRSVTKWPPPLTANRGSRPCARVNGCCGW
jgi:PAS domain S-box-containing protein